MIFHDVRFYHSASWLNNFYFKRNLWLSNPSYEKKRCGEFLYTNFHKEFIFNIQSTVRQYLLPKCWLNEFKWYSKPMNICSLRCCMIRQYLVNTCCLNVDQILKNISLWRFAPKILLHFFAYEWFFGLNLSLKTLFWKTKKSWK